MIQLDLRNHPFYFSPIPVAKQLYKDASALINKIAFLAYQAFVVVFFLTLYVTYRILKTRIFPLPNENGLKWLRRLFQDPVPISPNVGLDQRINPVHLTNQVLVRQPIVEYPEIDIQQYMGLFDQINLTDVSSPYYVDPESLPLDDDTPATFIELRQGLQSFLNGVSDGSIGDSMLLKRYLQNIYHSLTTRNISPAEKIDCLLDLARAGKRRCHTRMHQECGAWQERLTDQIEVETFENKISIILHDLRRQIILQEMARGDTHRMGEYLLAIGPQLGLSGVESAYNDDPILIYRLAPCRSLPNFFSRYRSDRIIDHTLSSINGEADPVHPGGRVNRQIPLDLITDWFRENLPDDFDPDNDERDLRYLSEHVYEVESNLVRREAVEYLLKRLSILTH